MRVLAVIPVRYESTRFPGKALFRIAGKSVLEHVYTRVAQSQVVDRVVIATDSPLVAAAARAIGAEVFISRRAHRCGTERVAEAASRRRFPVVINVQGDEVMVTGSLLRSAVTALQSNPRAWVGTVAFETDDVRLVRNRDLVKVVVDGHGRALYFSRSPIPCNQVDSAQRTDYYGHIGIYAYRNHYLQKFARLRPSTLERAERLEQLRVLEHGGVVQVAVTHKPVISINRKSDVRLVTKLLKE